MAKSYSEHQKNIIKEWEKGKLTFDYWDYIKNEDLQTKLNQLPEKLFQKPTFLEDKAEKDAEAAPTQSKQDKTQEVLQVALQLHLKSGDNRRAETLSDFLQDKLNRSLDWVSPHFHSKITAGFATHLYKIYIYSTLSYNLPT